MDKRRGGCITIFCQSFCLTITENVLGEPICVSEKMQVLKNFTQKKVISIFCANNFLSHRVQNIRRGTRLCFRKFRISKIFMDKRRGACITIFFQSTCLTDPKIFVWQPLSFSEKTGCRKNLRTMRGFHFFLLILFCLTVPNIFGGKHFGVSESFWFRKIFSTREVGVSRDFFKFFVSHYQKFS